MDKKEEKHENYEHSFKWAIYGISVASFLFILAAVYTIVRIVDGAWTDWKLPSILVIVFIVIVPISAMFTSLGDVKREIAKEMAKVKGKKDLKTQ